MFGFGKSQKDPLGDAKSAERWLASFPASDPLAVHAALLVELGALTERDARRTPARLEAIFYLDVQTEALRKSLTAQYLEHGNRSRGIPEQDHRLAKNPPTKRPLDDFVRPRRDVPRIANKH